MSVLPPYGERRQVGNSTDLDEMTLGVQRSDHLTVLVADDEIFIVEYLALLLEDEGCNVIKAFSGFEALEVVEQRLPDLIISDVMMPGMTGIDLAKRVGSFRRVPPPRIVLMSALSDFAKIPGVLFLRKPFDIERILELLAGIAPLPS